MNEQIKNRLKSFAWRLGGMIVIALIGFIIDNGTALNVPTWLVVVLGLVSGEVTKYLNS
jgi:membrane protein DedA with SNARE-associated domain